MTEPIQTMTEPHTTHSVGELLMSARCISVVYDCRAVLRNVNLDILRGDFIALSGPNGGGKTTFLRVMLKLLKPTRGTVTYYAGGKPAANLAIGYLPQKSNIDTRFPISVAEVVRSGALARHARGRSAQRYEEIVELMGIGDYLDKQIGELSGGQLQRTLLGRALMTDPEVLMLDEPLSYVDKRFERQIYNIMEQLASRCTIVLVSHEMSVISGMANRHLIIDHTLHECGALHHYVPGECDIDSLNSD